MFVARILTSVLFALLLCQAHAAETKPNIVFVLFDDMGWSQPQCYQPDSALRTPNLDRLASQGMRFTDAHSASAVCTPTRYGLLTGRYPSRIGQFGVLTTYSPPIISSTRLTVASLLKQHGYTTACIGKWHLGMHWVDGQPGDEKMVTMGAKMIGGPNAVGFDYFYGFTHARNIGSVIEQDRVVAHVSEEENQPLMINKAIEWIGQQSSKQPFFLYFPMCPPHTPIAPSNEFLGKSGAKDIVKNDPKYGDWVYQGDEMLGQIMQALDRNQLSENTLIMAASDNGAEGRAYEPLRASKRSIYEGGHRVPFVARWPGKTPAGSSNHHPICLNDLIATVAEVVGAKLPDNAGEDSISLVAELTGTADEPVHSSVLHQSMAGDLAIRQGPWKLVCLKNGQKELYRIDTDMSESSDVISQNPAVAKQLELALQRLIERGRSTPGLDQPNDYALSLPPANAVAKPSAVKSRKTGAKN